MAVFTDRTVFYGATAFNGNIGAWNTARVTTMWRVSRPTGLAFVILSIWVSGTGLSGVRGQEAYDAYVTLLTSDQYLIGLQVLHQTIRFSGGTRRFAAMVTPAVSEDVSRRLEDGGVLVVPVAYIENPHGRLASTRKWFSSTYTKLNVFGLTQFRQVIYLDADMIILRNIDELFHRPLGALGLAAVPEHMSTFNSGLLVLRPSRTVFESMLGEIHRLPSYDGGDQGFLNSFFHLWYDSPAANRLPIVFNVVQNFAHDEPTWRMITPDARVVHFCGQHEMKPWSQNNSFSNLVAPFIWIWRQHFAHRTDHARLLGASPHFMFPLCQAIFPSSHKIAEWFP